MYESRQISRWLRSIAIVTSVIAAILAFNVGSAFAQPTDTQKAEPTSTQEKPTARSHPLNPELWDVEQMMEEAVLQISRRYNLNKAQEEYTRMLLKERVRSFLDEYEDDVRELLAESIRLQTHPGEATIEEYRKWAERAKPVYEAAQTAIYNGNDEWREILDEQQKKLHDKDLEQMRRNFEQVSRVMEQWEDGRGVMAQAKNADGSTVGGRKVPPVIVRRNIEDGWSIYVEKFIEVYHLNEGQANSARAKILKEHYDKATAYRERRAKQFEAIDAALNAPKLDKKQMERRPQLREERRKLEQPIHSIFLEMDMRLLSLLDTEQLTAADEKGKKELAELKDALSGQKSESKIRKNLGVSNRPDPKQTTTAPASQPATTPPQKTDTPVPAVNKEKPAPTEAQKPATEKKPEASEKQQAEQKTPPQAKTKAAPEQKAKQTEPAPAEKATAKKPAEGKAPAKKTPAEQPNV